MATLLEGDRDTARRARQREKGTDVRGDARTKTGKEVWKKGRKMMEGKEKVSTESRKVE